MLGLGDEAFLLLLLGISFLNLKLRLGVDSSLPLVVGVADRPRDELRPRREGKRLCLGVLLRPRLSSTWPMFNDYFGGRCCCVPMLIWYRLKGLMFDKR